MDSWSGNINAKAGLGERRGIRRYSAPFCGNEDWDFWIAAVKNGLKAVHVSEPLYNYRRTAHSMSVSSLLYYDYVTRERIYARHKAFFDHHKAGKRFRAGGYLRKRKRFVDRARETPRRSLGLTGSVFAAPKRSVLGYNL